MTIIENENFRIQTITKLDRGEVNSAWVDAPVSYGLAIEKKCTLDSYYVIAYVKYNAKEESAEIESIGNRILDIELDEFELFKAMIKTAKNIVETANIKIV